MKVYTVVLVLMCSLVTNILCGQYTPMIEEGKFWIYLHHFDSDHPVPVTGHAITLQGDTTVNLINYKKVYKYNLKGHHDCPFPPCFEFDLPYQAAEKYLVSLIREDTGQKKVYNLPLLFFESFCDTNEYLLFDFSIDIGDTLNDCIYDFIGAGNDLPESGIVDSIKLTDKFGKLRNTIYTYGYPLLAALPVHDKVLLFEGVGLENYGIPHDPLSFLVDYCEGSMDPCQLILSNATVKSKNQITVFPNPANELCQISMEPEEIKSIKLYTVTGVLKKECKKCNTIDLSNVEGGFYFLEILSERGERSVKPVLKKSE